MTKHTNSPDTFEIELRTEILQFLAEYHQGLKELNGNGTAIEQFIKSLTALLKSKIPEKKPHLKVGERKTYESGTYDGYNQARSNVLQALGLDDENS